MSRRRCVIVVPYNTILHWITVPRVNTVLVEDCAYNSLARGTSLLRAYSSVRRIVLSGVFNSFIRRCAL